MENKEWRFNRIVVGIDGSAGANRALQWAVSQARQTGAEIVAVHVGQPLTSETMAFGFTAPVEVSNWQDKVHALFRQQWCLPLHKAGVPFRTVFEMGSAGPELITIAAREEAGLIVTGSRGLGPVREMIIGSVSHYLVQHSDIPVVVVPPERRVRERVAEPAVETRFAPLSAAPVLL